MTIQAWFCNLAGWSVSLAVVAVLNSWLVHYEYLWLV
jgi:hypothetical protein